MNEEQVARIIWEIHIATFSVFFLQLLIFFLTLKVLK